MMRIRLREYPSPAELAKIYNRQYDHTRWTDHHDRVRDTIQAGDAFARSHDIRSAADLSCGDKAILGNMWVEKKIFGDIIGDGLDIVGPIEQTVKQIDPVDLFVCSETLEHLNNPDAVLAQIREVTNYLLVTTPIGETNQDNPEHIWGWDEEAVGFMLRTAGFINVHSQGVIPTWHYTYQIWIVS